MTIWLNREWYGIVEYSSKAVSVNVFYKACNVYRGSSTD